MQKEGAIRSMPFAPKINKNSRKMADKVKNLEGKPSKKDLHKTSKQIKEE